MKTSDASVASPVETEETKELGRRFEPLDSSLDQIEQRAFAQTDVLNKILAREAESYWHHGGLNE